ncbi:hypothetical protein RF55_12848 [Lasius niger]|uniref:Uncharacterized protein n=1 Tax=Lasius niger TaxID=67767 RepID=A0A0J7KBP8_LASNI|nr:hypothetical protein RF55_17087 [Lasius niger]KMQ87783.1 hypothetical protein RF55_12848 [Lasius niger]
MNLTRIGDLLSDFDGVSGDFDTWEKQVGFVKGEYRLEDDYAKILIRYEAEEEGIRMISFNAGVRNRVPIDEDELLEHVIDGIPDVALRDQARIQGFMSTDSLLKAFEKITLRDRSGVGSIRQDKQSGGLTRGDWCEWIEGESNGGRGDDAQWYEMHKT